MAVQERDSESSSASLYCSFFYRLKSKQSQESGGLLESYMYSLLVLITSTNKPFQMSFFLSSFSIYMPKAFILFTCITISKMGMFMSFMGKGLPTTQMLSLVMGTLYRQFIAKDVKGFEEFHIAILEIFSTVNSALPGKHYDVPSPKDVEACFNEWKTAKESEKKKIFIEFMKKKVNLSKLDDSTLITGIVTPPAAMAAKRAGESVPQLKLIKTIPDVIFVPSATVLALVSVKLSRKMFLDNVAS